MTNFKWRAIFIAGVILLCLYGLAGLPNFPTSWAAVKQNFAQRIKLGLDLKGGTHLVLQVQVDEAVGLYCDQTVDALRRQMQERRIGFGDIRRVDETHILVSSVNPDSRGDFQNLIRDTYLNQWDFAAAPGEASGFLLTMKPSHISLVRADTMRQSIDTIERRINELGLTEPVVSEHGRGENEILVQLPGEGDPTRAKEVIRAGGQLELRLVVGERTFSSEAEALGSYNGVLPANSELVRQNPKKSPPGSPEVWYVLERAPVVTGRDLRSANPGPSGKNIGRYDVNFTLSVEAAQRFEPFTGNNIGRQMAIVLDKRVETAPTINGKIRDQGVIEGDFSKESATDLALVLRAGALPASIRYLEERTIGPSLGADSIRQGVQASIISLIAVMIFMPIYYRLAGVNAVVALILNLVILLACMAYFEAVFTLPGIAGVILSIGMGVDSNVLVFERIREELRGGKATAAAVDAGFDRAFLTIMDTHVTTVVSAFFLFLFGTGPVRGFAVTLVIGLVSNMFTAVFVSRTIFQWHLGRMPREAKLSV